MESITFGFVLLCGYIQLIAGQDACVAVGTSRPACTCTSISTGIIYDCSVNSLSEIPQTFSENVSEINLSNNQITTIKSGYLNRRSLQRLSLGNNRIDTIEASAFRELLGLIYLNLKNNFITKIDNNIFQHLVSLQTIDLSNNRITTIERYSFFTVPMLQTVNLTNNPLNCYCEERLLREFLSIRSFSLNLNLEGARCSNLNNNFLSSLKVSDFPGCVPGETLFSQSSSCHACADAAGTKDCTTKQTIACSHPRSVCYTQMDYNSGHLGVWGGCIDYDTCLGHEKNNILECKSGRTLTSCYFCSEGHMSNSINFMNTLKEFRVHVLVTLNAVMTSDLEDSTSPVYKTFTYNLATEAENHLKRQIGAYKVTFLDLRSPKVTIAFDVDCATMWFIQKSEVKDVIRTRLSAQRYNGFNVDSVYASFLDQIQCSRETTEDETYGVFTWPSVNAGAIAVVRCPYQLQSGPVRSANRPCLENNDGTVYWGPPNMSACPYADVTARSLQELAATSVNNGNVQSISANVSSLSNEWENFSGDSVSLVVDIVEDILTTDLSRTSRDVATNTLSSINNVMFVKTDVLTDSQNKDKSSERVLEALDNLLIGIDVADSDFQEVKDNVAGLVSPVMTSNFAGATLTHNGKGHNYLTDGKVVYQNTEAVVSDDVTGIVLPRSLLRSLSAIDANQVDKVTMSIIRDSNVFQAIVQNNETKEVIKDDGTLVVVRRDINSFVVGATVPKVTVANLREPVKITFQHLQAGENATCVFWDTVGRSWSTDGCSLNISDKSHTVCHCEHLTNFALLMDVYGTGGGLSDADRMALSIISYIGCGISFVAVMVTIFTYLMFKKLRRDNPSKILMNLCLAIGLVDFVFVVGMQGYTSNSATGCKIVAILLHYFLLAAMCWMAVEAFYMYMALVKVFDTYIAHFQMKSSLFGWGIPLVIVVITACINTSDNYGIQPGGICWLDQIPFYTAFLAPVCLILLTNVIVFILVLRQIMQRSSNKLTKSDKSQTAVRLRGAISLIILLGLTWLFAIFAVDNYGLVFHYLFAIFNSLQGFFIFIFYCLLKPEVKQSWKRALPCFKSPYEAAKTTTNSQGMSSSYNTNKTIKDDSGTSTTTTTNLDKSSEAKPAGTAFRGNWQYAVTDQKKDGNRI